MRRLSNESAGSCACVATGATNRTKNDTKSESCDARNWHGAFPPTHMGLPARVRCGSFPHLDMRNGEENGLSTGSWYSSCEPQLRPMLTMRLPLVKQASPLLLCLFLSPGCTRDGLEYFSLEDSSGAEVVEYGRMAGGWRRHSPMPIAYRLEREQYRIELRNVGWSPWGTFMDIRIEAKAEGGGELQLINKIPCSTSSVIWGEASPRRFAWYRCGDRQPKMMSFDVLAEDGSLVGHEDLPFRLIPNGFRYVFRP